MFFEILDQIDQVETIAIGNSIREISRLRKIYGPGRWRKMKGLATIRLSEGTVCLAELHWYEAEGIGRKEIKVKRIIEAQ